MDHAPLQPSNAARWAGQRCTASPGMERQYEHVVDTEAAQASAEGHAAHWVGAQMLRGHTWQPGMVAPNGLVVDEEMIEAAELYANDVRSVTTDLAQMHIEQIERAPAISPDNWGTPDNWVYLHPRLIIWDFKYGHRFIDAFMNWQLLDYLACVLSRPEFVGIDRRNLQIELRVVQPRSYHPSGVIRVWTVDAVTMAQAFTVLGEAAEEATKNPTTRVGAECRDCKARGSCVTLHNAADGVADTAGGPVTMDLPADALGVELRNLTRARAMLEARITGLEAQAVALIRGGQSVSFFTLEANTPREQWTKPIAEVIELGKLMGVDLVKPVAAVTPAQARKAGMDAAIIKAYSERPPGALKLVAADTMKARKVFQ